MKKTGGKAYAKAVKLGRKGIIGLIKKKGLTGRGGANFPTGLKWEMVFNEKADKKYVICNADEGEPGTFKDKLILAENPEAVVEGTLIAAYAVRAEKAFIYLRGEYEYLEGRLRKAVKDMLNKTRAKTEIELVIGAGAYVCGDETAIIQSIEGRRGHPQHKPPFPTAKGLYNRPTVINNAETLANSALAVLYDEWDPNLRLHSLSGNVERPGVYELPLGTKLGELIRLGRPKNKIKAVYFGCFGGCMVYDPDIVLHPDSICGKDCLLGACTVIAVDETKSILDMATNISKFYEFESCGKCTPCREGTMRILALLENISMGKATEKDLETLQELAEVIKETSFCGLGQTATIHVLNALKYFRKEFEEKVK